MIEKLTNLQGNQQRRKYGHIVLLLELSVSIHRRIPHCLHQTLNISRFTLLGIRCHFQKRSPETKTVEGDFHFQKILNAYPSLVRF